jgi:hypothetical protein
MLEVSHALDHLLVGAPSLEAGIVWLENRTGVRPVKGGSHPGLGTWNALASLGPRQYIEILAPDPGQPGVETFYVPGLREWKEPRIATWAAQGTDLVSRFTDALPTGFLCEPPRSGARIRPDGTRLAWTLAFPRHFERGTFEGALPFFIEWESLEDHPGSTSPTGLSLRAFSIQHEEPEALHDALLAIGLGAEVTASAKPSLAITLETPRGLVVLR